MLWKVRFIANFSEGGVDCALCCDGWKPEMNVMAAGTGNHSCPNPRHPNGMKELMGAI